MKLSTLYSRSVKGKINEFIIEIEDNKYRTITGFTDGIKTTSKFTTCEAKSYCSANEQAIKEATAIHRKKIETGSFENIKDIDSSKLFEPMLAKDYNKEKDKIKFPVYSQPKLDGIRCIVKKDGMWSRTGKPIVAAPHIFEALKPLFEKTPDLIFDGELYADKFASDFDSLCSIVKKTKPTKEDIELSAKEMEYWIYDLPSCNDKFEHRIQALKNMTFSLPKCCKVVNTYLFFDKTEIDKKLEEYLNQGYEGQMIRLNGVYENKRSKFLLKQKTFIDEEFIILDVIEGVGNKTGMVGSFECKSKSGKIFNPVPKFNWEQCIEMWNNKNQLIGKSATVKYFNLTPQGVPRFPYVIKIGREDYE
jgi:DNA ligase-1